LTDSYCLPVRARPSTKCADSRDSILAAPIVLDLVLFLDVAKRARMRGIHEWLSFYFKSPMCAPELYPEHDLFIQSMKLKNTLRWMMGEDLITHLGQEYYDQLRPRLNSEDPGWNVILSATSKN